MKTVCSKHGSLIVAMTTLSTLALFGVEAASAASIHPTEACTASSSEGGLLIELIIAAALALIGGCIWLHRRQAQRQRLTGVELKTCANDSCNVSDQVGDYCSRCGAELPPDTDAPGRQPASQAPRRVLQ